MLDGPDRPQPDPASATVALPRRLRRIAGDGWARVIANPSAMIVGSTAALNVLRLASNVVLARLLAPSVFALVAITTLVMISIHMISDVGIAITALREGEMSREDEDRLWTMQAIRGIGVSALVAAAAVPIGLIYGDVRLREALFVLALTPVIDGAKSLYPILALAHRKLLPSTVIELGGRTISILVSIAVAFVSPTIWSLVIATVVSTIASTVGSHVIAGRPPRFRFDRGYIARQWRFSRWIQTSSSLAFAGAQADKAAFPFLFGMSALGIYGIGATLASMPSQVTQRWSANVFYPLAVSMLRGEPAARVRLMTVRTTMLLYAAVITITLMAVSPPFFLLLYQPRYHAAAGIAVVLAAGTFFEVAESSLRHLPLVEGRPQFEVWAVVVRLVAFAVAVGIVLLTGAGVPGYALSYVAGMAASHLFMLAICVRGGYLRAGVDVALTVALAAAGVAIFALPLPTFGAIGLIVEGGAIGVAGAGALLAIYLRRGLPSLPAEPAPEVLVEAAQEEARPHVEDGLTNP